MSQAQTYRIWARWGWLALRIAITLGAFLYLSQLVPFSQLAAAARDIPLPVVVLAVTLTILNTGVATIRWKYLFHAYGAQTVPPTLGLWRLYLVGVFYSTFLPGGVGGDVVRGIASRQAFGTNNLAGPLAVVLVDRVLGLSGLLLLTATAFSLAPIPGVRGVFLWSALGLSAAAGSIAVVALGRRLTRHLPSPVQRLTRDLPAIARPRYLSLALLLSLATQSLVALTGHVLLASISAITPSQSIVIVPIANAAMYVPLTVAGAGAREAAFVSLSTSVGVPEASALAASLAMLLCQLVTAGLGGLLNAMPASRTQP